MDIKESYDLIAKEFSVTRVFTWTWTDEFINKMENNSNILDIGSGNGRNLKYDNVNITGLDISLEQLKMNNNVNENIQANMINLHFKKNMFDCIISIASFHHLNNTNDRIKALEEMKRILIPNGKILLSVWSINQPKKTRRVFTDYGDTIVPWRNIPRYYYIFKIDEITNLLEKYFTIEKHFWDSGNEIFELSNYCKSL